jgi:hypothetical protein
VWWVDDLIMAPPISRPGFELDGQAVHYNTSAMAAYSVGTVVWSHGVLTALAAG